MDSRTQDLQVPKYSFHVVIKHVPEVYTFAMCAI